MRFFALLACTLLLNACATIIEGTTQTVTVATEPTAATCTMTRQSETVGAIPLTPGSVTISKSRRDLDVACTKPGYQTATETVHARFVGTTFLNLLLGGVVGFIVDASSGANNVYPADVRMALPPSTRVPAQPLS